MPIPSAPAPMPSPSGRPAAPAAHLPPREPERFEPIAALFAVLLPGAGHYILGETRRALLIAAGVLGLFFGGIFIGGIDVIDRKEDRIWFLGQALVGPVAFGVDYLHQQHFKIRESVPGGERLRSPNPDENPRSRKSLGRMNELGTLFAAVAGMLNLIVIIDAAYHRRSGGGR